MKIIFKATILIALMLMFYVGDVAAIDPPHTSANLVYCNSCHTLHNALGQSLTKDTNANLCISCHTSSGLAAARPFAASDQANIGVSGTSHHWGGTMPATDDPNNAYGLRSVDSLSSTVLKTYLGRFGTCTNPAYTTKSTCETNLETWTAQVVCSVCHSVHSQANAPWDPFSSAYTAGVTADRHMMRIANDLNQLCEDCHYYRSAAAYTDVKTYDGTKKSHPVVMDLQTDVTDPALFVGTAPVESNCSAGSCPPQTGAPRYHLNGTGDTNSTNNIVLDSNGKIRCLSCHGMHYTDSDSSTVDQP